MLCDYLFDGLILEGFYSVPKIILKCISSGWDDKILIPWADKHGDSFVKCVKSAIKFIVW